MGIFVIPLMDNTTIGNFSEGLAHVYINNGSSFGYIDKSGQIKLVPSLHGGGNFHEGLALVMIDGKYNYIDKSLKVVIPSNFDGAPVQ